MSEPGPSETRNSPVTRWFFHCIVSLDSFIFIVRNTRLLNATTTGFLLWLITLVSFNKHQKLEEASTVTILSVSIFLSYAADNTLPGLEPFLKGNKNQYPFEEIIFNLNAVHQPDELTKHLK